MDTLEHGVDFGPVVPRGRDQATRIFFDSATPEHAALVWSAVDRAADVADRTAFDVMRSGELTYTFDADTGAHRCVSSRIDFVNACTFGRRPPLDLTVATETRRSAPLHAFPTASPDYCESGVRRAEYRAGRATRVVAERSADGACHFFVEARVGADAGGLVRGVLWVRKIMLGLV